MVANSNDKNNTKMRERDAMQGTLEAVHALLLYRIRMTGESVSARDISDIFGNLWMKIESTFREIDEDTLEEGWTFAVERVYDAAQNNPGSLVRSLLRGRVDEPEVEVPEEDHHKDLSWDPYIRIILAPIVGQLDDGDGSGILLGKWPRRVVPGLLNAVRLLVGDELIEDMTIRANDIMATLQRSALDLDTEAFWEKVTSHRDAQTIRTQIFARLITKFEYYEKRRDWLIRILNGELANTSDEAPSVLAANWRVTEHNFVDLMTRCIDLQGDLSSLPHQYREILILDSGPQGVTIGEDFVYNLSRDRGSNDTGASKGTETDFDFGM